MTVNNSLTHLAAVADTLYKQDNQQLNNHDSLLIATSAALRALLPFGQLFVNGPRPYINLPPDVAPIPQPQPINPLTAASFPPVSYQLISRLVADLQRQNMQHIRTGQWQLALNNCNQALAMMPESSTLWQQKGFLHSMLNHWHAANECFNRALNINPHDTQALLGKVRVHLTLRDYDTARRVCDYISTISAQSGTFAQQ